MLISILTGSGTLAEKLLDLAMIAVIVLFSLTVHEVAHGWVAYKLGDPTAKYLGRLTLNPAKHLDPIGAIMMLLIGVGYAKPVPVNSRYFKHPKRDMALTAAAGPASNFIMAFFASLVCVIVYKFAYKAALSSITSGSDFSFNFLSILYLFFELFALLNLSLAIFNLIPIPPFDGSRIAFIFLPERIYFAVMKYERFILLGVLVFFWTFGRNLNLISRVAQFFFGLFTDFWSLIPFLR